VAVATVVSVSAGTAMLFTKNQDTQDLAHCLTNFPVAGSIAIVSAVGSVEMGIQTTFWKNTVPSLLNWNCVVSLFTILVPVLFDLILTFPVASSHSIHSQESLIYVA